VVRAEADRRVRERERLDTRVSRRGSDGDDDVAAYLLEAAVAVGARARVPEDPAVAGALAGQPHRGVARLPRTRGTSGEPDQRRIVGVGEQADGGSGLTAEDRLRELTCHLPLRSDRRLVL